VGNAGELGQQHLRFVRRGVCCCSAVARGFLLLSSPSLGVSSLDLGRSRKVSGLFLFRAHQLLVICTPSLFGGGPVWTQFFQRDFGKPVGQHVELGRKPDE
jgi:hypothetical protein